MRIATISCSVRFASTMAPALVVAAALSAAPATAGYSDRIERRAGELALPDEVLDPSWPVPFPDAGDSAIAPGVGDSVEDEFYLDEAERLELERYLVERGIIPDPTTPQTPSPLGGDPDPARAADGALGQEYNDPAEW